VDQAADGGLEEEGDGLSMSRAILTAQKHGQLDKCRSRLNVEGTSPCNMEVLQYNPEILIEYGLQTLNECKLGSLARPSTDFGVKPYGSFLNHKTRLYWTHSDHQICNRGPLN
jgi:hypothetical protein